VSVQQKYRKGEFRRLSWNEYGKTLEALYRKVDGYLKRVHESPDAVVPILRGGAVAGTYLAYRLKLLTILPVQYKYLESGDRTEPRKLLGLDKSRIGGIKRPVFLLVENNHCFGGTAQKAAADLKKAFPRSRIIYAAAHSDYTNRKLKLVDVQFYGRITNEARGLSPSKARGKRIPNWIYVFPWENFDEEFKAVNSQKYKYRDLDRVKRVSTQA
jgi:hypothetical protein